MHRVKILLSLHHLAADFPVRIGGSVQVQIPASFAKVGGLGVVERGGTLRSADSSIGTTGGAFTPTAAGP